MVNIRAWTGEYLETHLVGGEKGGIEPRGGKEAGQIEKEKRNKHKNNAIGIC